MENTSFLFSVLGLVSFALVAILLIVLWKKGLLTDRALDAIGDLAEGIILPQDGPIGTLAYYARLAVRAVEQLVKSGQLNTEGNADVIRREKALELVQLYAATSGPALNEAEINTVRSLIEAEVYALHNDDMMTFTNEIEIQPHPDAAPSEDQPVTGTVMQANSAVEASVKKRTSRTKKQADEPITSACP